MRINQKQRVINYIREFGSITSFEAYKDLGITQLGARIDGLQKDGYVFKTEWQTGENRYGEPVYYKKYFLDDMTAENMEHVPQIEGVR